MTDYNKKIIEEISKELGISKSKVEHVTKFFFNWQREKFIECDNVEFKWSQFGKFRVMKNRYEDMKKNKELKQNKLKTKTIKNNNDNYEQDEQTKQG